MTATTHTANALSTLQANAPDGDSLSAPADIGSAAREVSGDAQGSTGDSLTSGTTLPPAAKKSARKAAAKRPAKKAGAKKVAASDSRRQRRTPLFPATTFEDALELAVAVNRVGAGQPVRRITLFNDLGRSPDSGASRQLIINSAKYGLTTGGYQAEFISLTEDGKSAVAEDSSTGTLIRARFKLAIQDIEVFRILYETYLGNRLPTQAVMMDKAREAGVPQEDVAECVETFTVNTKFVGVLQSISGAERLLSVDTVIEDFTPREPTDKPGLAVRTQGLTTARIGEPAQQPDVTYDSACFYISPIGSEGSEQRKHADLFMGSLIEPALAEFKLNLVRADKIGQAGMITGQIIEHIIHSKLVVVDLSFHNPNVFYELALRHAVRKPIVQITRAADRLPFDIAQVRTVVVDTTDIYTLVPRLESLKAQIAAQIRKTLEEDQEVENPLSIFMPRFWDFLPKS